MLITRVIWQNRALVCGCLLSLAVVFHPAGARADWLQDLETDAVTWMTEYAVPGMAIAIVQNDVVIYAKGFGHLSVDPASPLVDANTVFQIASCTKAFTATQLALLADQGKLDWHDLVSQHLPAFQMYDPWVNSQFQIEDLLVHRSGLVPQSQVMMAALGYSPSDMVRGIRFVPPFSSFRGKWDYQNNMYTAASQIIEAETHQSWAQNLKDSIFTPLGMTRSVTTQAETNQMTNVAAGHLLLTDGSLWPIPPDWFWNYAQQDHALGAAAIRSCANDMAQWLRLHLALGRYNTKQIVTQANMHYLHSPIMLVNAWEQGTDIPYWGPKSYGGGWYYYSFSPQPLLLHDGGSSGFRSCVGLIPGANAGIVILTNIGSSYINDPVLIARSGLAVKIGFRFYDLFLNRGTSVAQLDQYLAANQGQFQDVPTAAPAPLVGQASGLPLDRYCGVFHHPAYGSFVVSQSGGSLVITMGPLLIRSTQAYNEGNNFQVILPDYPAKFPGAYISCNFAFPSAGPPTLTAGLSVAPQNEVFRRIDPISSLRILLLDD